MAVKGQKTGKDRIYQWLDNLDKKKDTDPHAILVTPDEVSPMIWYLTKKTGTLSPAERKAAFGTEDKQEAWARGISVKAGYFIRAITIDGETGEPTSTWTGTIGQLMKHVTDESVLYIMEDERRAVEKAEKRKQENEVNKEKFINYFKGEYLNVLNRAMAKKSQTRSADWEKLRSEIGPEEFGAFGSKNQRLSEMSSKLQQLFDMAKEIKSGSISESDLDVYYSKWIEYMAGAGDYIRQQGYRGDERAELSDIIKKHTMMGACNRFLQYIVTGKISSAYLDVMKQLGIDTGIDLGTADIDLSDLDI